MGIVALAPALAAALCCMSCVLIVPRLVSWAQGFTMRMSIRFRMTGEINGRHVLAERELRNPKTLLHSVLAFCFESGFPSLRRASSRLLACSGIENEVARIVTVLKTRNILATPDSVCQALMAFGIVLAVATLLLFQSVLSTLLVIAIGIVLAHARVSKVRAEFVDRSQELIPDAMRALGVYYGSGLTLIQSFEHAAEEVPSPLGPRLGEVAVNMKAGMPPADALSRLREDFDDSRPITFASIALEIQHVTGAPMRPLLESVAQSVSASLRLKRSLEVQTAQARLSAKVVSIMPLLIIGLMALVNPSYLLGFLSSSVGLAIFLIACALELAGIIAIRKILNVEVC